MTGDVTNLDTHLLQIYLADHQAGARGVMHRLKQMKGYADPALAALVPRLYAEVGEE